MPKNTLPSIRLFIPSNLSNGIDIELSKDQTHYLYHVMRQKEGNALLLFNGKDGEWLSKITFLDKRSCIAQPEKQTRTQTSSNKLTLCFAPVKNAPLHSLVQKATELGVSDLQPVITEHTIVRKINIERVQANAIEAAEQSLRLSIPNTHSLVTLHTLIENWDSSHILILCDESGGGTIARETIPTLANTPCAIIIGPEGGFSQKELALLRKQPFVKSIGMGPRILRADTAAIAALTCYQSLIGDWDEQPHFNNT